MAAAFTAILAGRWTDATMRMALRHCRQMTNWLRIASVRCGILGTAWTNLIA